MIFNKRRKRPYSKEARSAIRQLADDAAYKLDAKMRVLYQKEDGLMHKHWVDVIMEVLEDAAEIGYNDSDPRDALVHGPYVAPFMSFTTSEIKKHPIEQPTKKKEVKHG